MPNNIYGFTGTREGISLNQKQLLIDILITNHNILTVRHGCCVGADRDFHLLVRSFRPDIEIIGHPPIDEKLFAKDVFNDCTRVMGPKQYLDRNMDIATMSDIMIGAPLGPEITRSGTWQAIRFAIKSNKPTYILR